MLNNQNLISSIQFDPNESILTLRLHCSFTSHFWGIRMVRNIEYTLYTSQIMLQSKLISYKLMVTKFQQDCQRNQYCMLPLQGSTTKTSAKTYLCHVCPSERWGQLLWAGRAGKSHPRSSERSLHLHSSVDTVKTSFQWTISPRMQMCC